MSGSATLSAGDTRPVCGEPGAEGAAGQRVQDGECYSSVPTYCTCYVVYSITPRTPGRRSVGTSWAVRLAVISTPYELLVFHCIVK
jgi:hypothetical protein